MRREARGVRREGEDGAPVIVMNPYSIKSSFIGATLQYDELR